MSEFSQGSPPGASARQSSSEAQVWWAGRGGQNLLATRMITLDKSNTDDGADPATTIRAGYVLALEDESGNAYLYDPDANDGRQVAVGLLEHTQDMLQEGAAADRFTQMLVTGLAKESQVLALDTRARQQLAGRFVFDAVPLASPAAPWVPRGVYCKAADFAVTAADHGTLLIATAAVNFTLPAKENGLAFRFFQTADADLVITGSSDIVTVNNAAASTLTFGTSSEKIGSHAHVECVYTAEGTLKWVATNLGGTTLVAA